MGLPLTASIYVERDCFEFFLSLSYIHSEKCLLLLTQKSCTAMVRVDRGNLVDASCPQYPLQSQGHSAFGEPGAKPLRNVAQRATRAMQPWM